MPRFANLDPTPMPTLRDVLRWKFTSKANPWPKWIEVSPGTPPVRERTRAEISLTVVNHSTVLVGVAGRFFLTDPIWSERASPVPFAGPRRVHAPGLRLEDLPALDGILLSHNHYDHCDLGTLGRLARDHPAVTVFTGLGNGPIVRRAGFSAVRELGWWDSEEVHGMRLHFTPTKHFSARGLGDRFRTLWGGFVLETPLGRIYFAGDTAAGRHDAMLAERFDGFTVAMIPIGAYEPRWFMRHSHMNPEEAVATHRAIRARRSVTIHHGTFAGLTDEGRDEPVRDLFAAMDAAGLARGDFLVPGFGETVWFS